MPEKIHKSILNALPAKSKKDQKDYVALFYSLIPDSELKKMEPGIAAQTALLHYKCSLTLQDNVPDIQIQRHTLEDEEGRHNLTLIDIIQSDRPFIVDSVVAEIVRQKLTIHFLIHPMLKVSKTKTGLTALANVEENAGTALSHMHIQIQGRLTDNQIKELRQGLQSVLADVYYATIDWLEMREKLREAQRRLSHAPKQYNDSEIEEYQAFLEYIYSNNFTLLGYREYKFVHKDGAFKSQTIKGKSLGLLRDEVKPVYINEARSGLTAAQQKMRADQQPLTIAKANKRSTVHRPVPLDVVAIKDFDKKGNVVGEMLFIGLFTSVTYSRSISDIPYLRMKTGKILKRTDYLPQSHDYKALKHILEKYPRDELFQIDDADLYKHAISILRLQERPRIALYIRNDPFGRYISALTYIPRERFETRIRKKFTSILEEELGGKCSNFMVTQDDSPLARVIFFIDINHLDTVPKYDEASLEQKLVEAGRVWADRLKVALEKSQEEDNVSAQIVYTYGNAFPVSYKEQYSFEDAIQDVSKLENCFKTNTVQLRIHKPHNCENDKIRLKIFNPDHSVILSDILPLLENMGFRVLDEFPFEIKPRDYNKTAFIHDFLLDVADKSLNLKIEDIRSVFEEALLKIISQDMENDSLNKLVIGAEMNWRHVSILRTYVRYMRQMNVPFSRQYIERALTTYPEISGIIVDLFEHRLNPEKTKDSKMNCAGYLIEIDHAMDAVSSLDFDRILRTLTKLVEATLRTNFFQSDENGNPKSYISVKFDSRIIADLPDPKPYREIFVYSPRVEGIHLRGDVIARGGIRWSDRHEDFRTEVLGLMKAQMVKNAVIVPMGAKGGFVVKNAPLGSGPQAVREEGIECYKIFVRGLLDITDNRSGGKVIPPKSVVRQDGDDPYLVVAADKGTATFSDIANALSLDYGFWMGDAFASGGSAGYDHKVMGITARGAWESVKRHFRELNHDTQTQAFDVIGIGDMGGDVFGNGMLLSDHIRLIGAFNHLHIFCDPDPDTKKTYKERQRLFNAVKGWDAYDTELLSKGGRIYNRSDKSLELTAEIKTRFDIGSDRVTPNELIQAILKARVDLLWFGGIGTYVKARSETHDMVGDKGNDGLRINANELRAKVIGEGANLAITQRARVEAAQHGVHLNADFIDNSAGVDSSDNEVNIKILLADVMRKKSHNMDVKKRNKLLVKMTDEVADNVLRHNYQQVQGISLIEYNASSRIAEHAELINRLEKTAGLNRKIEFLPNEEEIEERRRNGKGLTRPEISILVSYAKIDLTQDLLKTNIPDSKAVEDWVTHYFPKALRHDFHKEIINHQLKREIIATMLANGMINRMGPTFIVNTIDKCGVSSAEVAKAYIIVREAFGLRKLWDQIESLDNKVPAMVQMRAMDEISRMAERAIIWFLTRLGRDLSIEKDIEAFQSGIEEVRRNLDKVVANTVKQKIKMASDKGESDGLPKDSAHAIALMPLLSSACDIIRISQSQNQDITITARAYFELGEYFYLDWIRQQASYIPAEDSWSSEALEGLVDQLYSSQAGMTARILDDMKDSLPHVIDNNTRILDIWIANHDVQVDQIKQVFQELRGSSQVTLAMLMIAEQRLRHMYGG